jgi:hypothetical protein
MNQQIKQPTPLEALDFLDQMASKVTGDRITHINIQAAVDLIREALAPKPEGETPAEPLD